MTYAIKQSGMEKPGDPVSTGMGEILAKASQLSIELLNSVTTQRKAAPLPAPPEDDAQDEHPNVAPAVEEQTKEDLFHGTDDTVVNVPGFIQTRPMKGSEEKKVLFEDFSPIGVL